MSKKKFITDKVINELNKGEMKVSELKLIFGDKVQEYISSINKNKIKFKNIFIIRKGKHGKSIYELMTGFTEPSDICSNLRNDDSRAINSLKKRYKGTKLSINTRKTQEERVSLLTAIIQRNAELITNMNSLLLENNSAQVV